MKIATRTEIDCVCHFQGQQNLQPSYVELDCEGETLTAGYNSEIGNAVPQKIWHGLSQRWLIKPLSSPSAEDLLQRIAPLCSRIIAGFKNVWDGSNHVGQYSDDAVEAIDEVDRICQDWGDETDTWSLMDAAVWDDGQTKVTDGTDIDAVAHELTQIAASQLIVLYDLDQYLASRRV